MSTESCRQLTVIDCTPISGEYTSELQSRAEFIEFAKTLGQGLSGSGFIYFMNHGIPPKVLTDVFDLSKQFFELDPEMKIKYKKVDPVKNFHGYTPPTGDEIANEADKSSRDFKESFSFVGREIPGENYPEEVPALPHSIQDFHSVMSSFSKKIMLALGLYLNLDEPEFFLKHHKALNNLLDPDVHPWIDIRSNYYLPLDDEEITNLPEDALRLTEHSDWGTLTFLVQDDSGGLEAKVEGRDGFEWVPVAPIPGSIVLNSGLMLEIWSGGRFHAAAHRVRLFKERANEMRQSLVWFVAPDGDTKVKTLLDEKKGWSWKHPYPLPGEQIATEYFKDRIKGIYSSRYY